MFIGGSSARIINNHSRMMTIQLLKLPRTTVARRQTTGTMLVLSSKKMELTSYAQQFSTGNAFPFPLPIHDNSRLTTMTMSRRNNNNNNNNIYVEKFFSTSTKAEIKGTTTGGENINNNHDDDDEVDKVVYINNDDDDDDDNDDYIIRHKRGDLVWTHHQHHNHRNDRARRESNVVQQQSQLSQLSHHQQQVQQQQQQQYHVISSNDHSSNNDDEISSSNINNNDSVIVVAENLNNNVPPISKSTSVQPNDPKVHARRNDEQELASSKQQKQNSLDKEGNVKFNTGQKLSSSSASSKRPWYKMLDAEHLRKLKELDYPFFPHEIQWDKQLANLTAFVKIHGHFPRSPAVRRSAARIRRDRNDINSIHGGVSSSSGNTIDSNSDSPHDNDNNGKEASLFYWCQTQRGLYFKWNKSQQGHQRRQPQQQKPDNIDTTTASISNAGGDHASLYDTVAPIESKRKTMATMSMTLERVEKLEAIGFVWNHNDENWQRNYNKLVQFNREHGHTFVPIKYTADPSLGLWVSCQRYAKTSCAADSPRMTPERERLLNEVNFVWDAHEARWHQFYNEYSSFTQRTYPGKAPLQKYRQLYDWHRRQCRHHREYLDGEKTPLTEERVELFEDSRYSRQ